VSTTAHKVLDGSSIESNVDPTDVSSISSVDEYLLGNHVSSNYATNNSITSRDTSRDRSQPFTHDMSTMNPTTDLNSCQVDECHSTDVKLLKQRESSMINDEQVTCDSSSTSIGN
jgi:hypothetical protein